MHPDLAAVPKRASALASGTGTEQSVYGVRLEPGERVLAAQCRRHRNARIGLCIAGLLTAVFLIGFLLILAALVLPPFTADVVTDRRFMHVEGSKVLSVHFAEIERFTRVYKPTGSVLLVQSRQTALETPDVPITGPEGNVAREQFAARCGTLPAYAARFPEAAFDP